MNRIAAARATARKRRCSRKSGTRQCSGSLKTSVPWSAVASQRLTFLLIPHSTQTEWNLTTQNWNDEEATRQQIDPSDTDWDKSRLKQRTLRLLLQRYSPAHMQASSNIFCFISLVYFTISYRKERERKKKQPLLLQSASGFYSGHASRGHIKAPAPILADTDTTSASS